jgi:ABC-type multidrug transport system permease subunit
MLKFFIALQLAVLTVRDALEDRARFQRDERGSVTIQEVLWAVAAIAIVGIVVAAIRAFVTSESGKIK